MKPLTLALIRARRLLDAPQSFRLCWLFVAVLASFNCKNARRFKQEYYPGTKVLKSEGYYIKNIPIDTIKRYSKEGWLESTDVYDSNGTLNGECRTFYPNGVPSQIFDYRHGRENGRGIFLREDGTRDVVGLFYHGKPMGDVYYYDTLNALKSYNFLGFNKELLMACKYDPDGARRVEKDDFYFIDSVTMGKGKNGVDTIKTLLLISHEPKTSMKKIRVDNVGGDGRIIQTKEIDADVPLAYYKNVASPEVDTIKEIGVRYDSVSGKSKKYILEHLMKDLR